jgi:tetratricopeptide (TPR) repeat protein
VLFRKKPYDRSTTLAAADKARGRGSIRKAVLAYSQILAQDPEDHQVHARIAPLLAKMRRWKEARASFDAAGQGLLKAGFNDKAIAVWTVAAHHFPEDVEYWERIANENVHRGRKADAIKSLLEGRSMLRTRRQRPLAILLLRQVLSLQPIHFETTLDLARLLSAEGDKAEASKLLENLRRYAHGHNVRRLRAAQFRMAPGFRAAIAWIAGR